jgi:hypothetical protein
MASIWDIFDSEVNEAIARVAETFFESYLPSSIGAFDLFKCSSDGCTINARYENRELDYHFEVSADLDQNNRRFLFVQLFVDGNTDSLWDDMCAFNDAALFSSFKKGNEYITEGRLNNEPYFFETGN